MSNNYGKRVEPGDIIDKIYESIVVVSLCPYLQAFHGLESKCVHHGSYDRQRRDEESELFPGIHCPNDCLHIDGDPICYVVQCMNAYERTSTTTNINGKEVRIMDIQKIADARRTPDGVCIAVGDIVNVKLGYISRKYDPDSIVQSKAVLIGRITSFGCPATVSLDCSAKFDARSVTLNFSEIESITINMEETHAYSC